MEAWLKKYYERAVDYWNRTGRVAGVEDIYDTMVVFVAEDLCCPKDEAERVVFEALNEDEKALFDLIDDEF